MSDAFADLWNSTGASKPAEAPRKLGAMAAATPVMSAQRKPQNDMFSMLAAAGSSSSVNTRATTPAQSLALASNTLARPLQKVNSTVPNGGGLGGDAFSGLLSGSFSSGSNSNGTNLTIAQRAALAEKQRQANAAQKKAPAHAAHVSSTWAGLDALGGGTSVMSSTKSSTPSQDPQDDLGFGSFSSTPTTSRTPSKSPQPPPPIDEDWLGDFTAAKPTAPPASKPKLKPTSAAQSLLDWDEFEADPPARPSATQTRPQNDTLGDFDFGDREDGLLGHQSGDEDDILGDLGKPVEQLQAKRSARNTPSPQHPQSGQRSRAVSPPPHLLGQIVEMGFSVQQARIALAATDTGLDVQAALETLLANGAASSSPPPERQEECRHRQQRGSPRRRDYGSDEEDGTSAVRSRQQRPARDRPQPDETPPSRADTQRNLQEQADKLISQASEIGLNMFSRANAFWKGGKERVQRAYEERVVATGSSRPNAEDGPHRNGRPKWMQDAPEDGHVPEDIQARGGFRDLDDDGPSQPSRPQPKQQAPRAKEPPQQPAESPASRFKTDKLLSEDAPSVYVSPWRRKAPSRGHSEAASPAPAAFTPSRPTPSPRTPSPVALIQRTCVSASSSAISASAQQKALGTEKFKLGQYGEAETFYTVAIAALPANHLLLVPLLNNRALTRLKNGDASGAVEDCTAVIALIGPAYHPAREAKVAREDEGASVDLADGLVKAYKRRAEAYEGREKWELARADWEVVAGADFAGRARTEAVTGIGRCRRMLNTDAETGASPPKPAVAAAASRPKPALKPKLKPTPRARVPTPPSEALNRVQAQNRAAEAEDQQKAELKDTVDARLGAWKAGKENNIRALIASLDTVLWPELGWQKVGIHELVSPSQVKIRYTKAIAKLHPDKLNVKNTTLEQRMIANGVFGALNEAWNVFKP